MRGGAGAFLGEEGGRGAADASGSGCALPLARTALGFGGEDGSGTEDGSAPGGESSSVIDRAGILAAEDFGDDGAEDERRWLFDRA